ncbi:MAG: ABC transporter permease [Candidatus Heimdallarchaeota archaeon]|nr:MAG: ABC transporter permease [Candidatus Heimdallarchaeota archaeon]
MTSFFYMSWQALTDRKLRSTLTIIMVLIGSALIIAVNGMSKGTVVYIDKQLDILNPNILVITPRSSDLELTDYEIGEISQIDGISQVIPFIQSGVQVSSGQDDLASIVVGIDNNMLDLIFPTFALHSGVIVPESDSFGIILGNDLVRPEDENPFAKVGDVVKLAYQKTEEHRTTVEEKSFYVRGVMDYIGSSGMLVPVDDMCFISLREADQYFDRNGIYDGLYVITADDSLNREIRDQINSLYDVSILNPKMIVSVINQISTAVADFVNNIAVVSLGVAAVGIITTLYTSMLERTKEIGTLKALGYTKRQILVLFLNEALIIGLIGGTIGLGLGVVLGQVMNELVSGGGGGNGEYNGGGGGGWNMIPIFEPHIFVFTWVLAVILSMAAGFYPAWRAAELDPVVALRKE